jgi:hypothetical protein
MPTKAELLRAYAKSRFLSLHRLLGGRRCPLRAPPASRTVEDGVSATIDVLPAQIGAASLQDLKPEMVKRVW